MASDDVGEASQFERNWRQEVRYVLIYVPWVVNKRILLHSFWSNSTEAHGQTLTASVSLACAYVRRTPVFLGSPEPIDLYTRLG